VSKQQDVSKNFHYFSNKTFHLCNSE